MCKSIVKNSSKMSHNRNKFVINGADVNVWSLALNWTLAQALVPILVLVLHVSRETKKRVSV